MLLNEQPSMDRRARNEAVSAAIHRRRHWLWILPALVFTGAAGAFVWLQTPLYRAEGTMMVVPPKVPSAFFPSMPDSSLETRLPAIRNEILSRSRLERIIADLSLYPTEQETMTLEATVEIMRGNISVRPVFAPNQSGSETVAIGFVSPEPKLAKVVAERLLALFIDESTRDRKIILEGTAQFLDSSLKAAEASLNEREARTIEARRRKLPSSITEDIDLEILKSMYRKLRNHKAETEILANLERREIGEQLKVIEAPALPTRPVNRNGWRIVLGAAAVGLVIGLTLFYAGRRLARDQPRLARHVGARATPA